MEVGGTKFEDLETTIKTETKRKETKARKLNMLWKPYTGGSTQDNYERSVHDKVKNDNVRS